MREQLLQSLRNRLELIDHHKRHSETLHAVNAPVIVTGMPRSGTTFLHNLLGQDVETFRGPLNWEIQAPLPVTNSKYSLRRLAKLAVVVPSLAFFSWIAKRLSSVHPLAAFNVEECMPLMALDALSLQFNTLTNVSSYNDWYIDQDQIHAFRMHEIFLQTLQEEERDTRWLLKAPWHINHLHTLFVKYPDARIVITHREPSQMLASLSSLHARFYGVVSDAVDPTAIGAYQLKQWAKVLGRYVAVRSDPQTPNDRIFDGTFEDLQADPIRFVERVYAFLDLELTADARRRMTSWLETDSKLGKKGASGKHAYEQEWFGLDDQQKLDQTFAAYKKMHVV